jgi:ATP-dependent protease HslVU (ClpYQ) peptidase subunit
MTCVVGLLQGDKIHFGADTAATNGWSLAQAEMRGHKVFCNGIYAFGGCGSIRLLQLLEHALEVGEPDWDNLEGYMATEFANLVRHCLRSGGFLKRENHVETFSDPGCFMVGVGEHLFVMYEDFSVIERAEPYEAIGSGEDIALGSLYSTAGLEIEPQRRVEMALEAAARFNAGVRAPFNFITYDIPAFRKELVITTSRVPTPPDELTIEDDKPKKKTVKRKT